MFLDAADLSTSGVVEADVCIVGGGAAGIALALALADSPLQVVLVEGGGLDPNDATRSAYRVLPGVPASLGTDQPTGWFFGGNTNAWSGNCRPLDESDFESHEWQSWSGWPIQLDELLPYYGAAQMLMGLGELRLYDPEECRPLLAHPPLDVDPSLVATRIVQVCPVLSLAERHRARLEGADDVQVLLRAEATKLLTNRAVDRVTGVEIVGPDRRRVRIDAETVVLAAGGVENARLLLASNEGSPNGLGNEHDLVGRSFMEHWWLDLPLGAWGRSADVGLYEFGSEAQQVVDGVAVWGQLALSRELMRDEQVPGLSVWFRRLAHDTPSVLMAWRTEAAARRRRLPQAHVIQDARLALADPLEVPRSLTRRLFKRGNAYDGRHALRIQLEQTPDPENRLRLSSSRDALGRPKVELALRLTDDERRRHERALDALSATLGLDGSRLVRQMRPVLDAGRCDFFWHHMGATRMANDAQAGVVDRDCRVHGLANLFVAGSSVFPTCGIAPPTLTIVALALRLADHLTENRTQ